MAALFLLIILEDFHATPGWWKRNEVRENGCVQYKRNGDGGKFSRCNIFFSFPFESTHRNRRWRDRDKNGERLVPFRESECRTSQFLEARRLLWFLSFLSLAGHNAYLHPPRLVPPPPRQRARWPLPHRLPKSFVLRIFYGTVRHSLAFYQFEISDWCVEWLAFFFFFSIFRPPPPSLCIP